MNRALRVARLAAAPLTLAGAVAWGASMGNPTYTTAQAAPNETKVDGDHKVWVCHRTSSERNPYNLIHVDVSAADGPESDHRQHADEPNKDGRRDLIEGYNVPLGSLKSEEDCVRLAASLGTGTDPNQQIPEVPMAAVFPALGATTFAVSYGLRKLRRRA